MEQEQFHIDFNRSGGLTGISTRVEIDSSDLDHADAEELKYLIHGSGFFETPAFNNSLNLPDQFLYNITIEHMGKRRTLELHDGSAPESLRPLLNYLTRIARKRKK